MKVSSVIALVEEGDEIKADVHDDIIVVRFGSSIAVAVPTERAEAFVSNLIEVVFDLVNDKEGDNSGQA